MLKLHHALSYECLLEMNISPTVTKMLAGCDDIIRQHKLACLRVTALLCCKELLWIGTSAGILLHLPLPHLTPTAGKIHNIPQLSSVAMGHAGPCRLLISAELHPGSLSHNDSGVGIANYDHNRRRRSLNFASVQQGKV